MGLSFVPVTIASLTGVDRSDAGVASGLINTSRQIGGAIGLATTSAVAAAATSNYAASHPAVTTSSSVALNHGYQTALYVLTGLLLVGALIAVTLLRPRRPRARTSRRWTETSSHSTRPPDGHRSTHDVQRARLVS